VTSDEPPIEELEALLRAAVEKGDYEAVASLAERALACERAQLNAELLKAVAPVMARFEERIRKLGGVCRITWDLTRDPPVLRLEFGIGGRRRKQGTHPARTILASRKMTPSVRQSEAGLILQVDFHGGPSKQLMLPSRDHIAEFRIVLEDALHWAAEQGATDGQLAYIRKVLNRAGYYLQGPRM